MVFFIRFFFTSTRSIFLGPVAQTGRALPLQGRGPGFKSRWVHFSIPFLRSVLISAAPIHGGIRCEGEKQIKKCFFFLLITVHK